MTISRVFILLWLPCGLPGYLNKFFIVFDSIFQWRLHLMIMETGQAGQAQF